MIRTSGLTVFGSVGGGTANRLADALHPSRLTISRWRDAHTFHEDEAVSEKPEFTDEEIYKMRRFLAKRWRQSIDQVTDYEARAYLRVERSLAEELDASRLCESQPQEDQCSDTPRSR